MELGKNHEGFLFTSSPIEGKRNNDSPNFGNSTWSALLGEYKAPQKESTTKTESNRKEEHIFKSSLTSESSSCLTSSSSYQPIAEHKMKILLTPGNKIKILSNSSRKIHRPKTPMKPLSYSKLSQNYRQRFEGVESEEEESVDAIKQKMKSKENLTMSEVERFEKILIKHIENKQRKKSEALSHSASNIPTADSVLMQFLENQLGQLNLSPSSRRSLRMENEEQEKRLISLAITKRKSAAEIKQKIEKQQALAKEQIKNRETMELQQIKAANLRRKALAASTLFTQAHSAHHQRKVKMTRLKNNASQLQQQLKMEKNKNSSQAHQIVRDVWGTFLREQYEELRKEVGQQRQEQEEMVKNSEAQIQQFKSTYEEKIKELKNVAAAKAVEAGMEKKEVARELDRIQRNMRQHFQLEFQNLLQTIETKGDHRRLMRGEKATILKEQIRKADYVFDI